MTELACGDKLKTISGRSVTVTGELGRGGQGIVYSVQCGGRERALKWYYRTSFEDQAKKKLFFTNLVENVQDGPPKGAEEMFVWPYDVVYSAKHHTFGYVMDKIPGEYRELSEYQMTQCFSGYRARVNAMVNIARGFRVLHNAGYKYQDINNGNIFIRPDDGDILICDNDNAAKGNRANGVVGKDRYMAPEVLMGLKMPDQTTDRFSMAVLLFLLACKEHPLTGRAMLDKGVITEEEKAKIYGSHPLFIFDEKDDANRPDPQEQKHVITNWRAVPVYVRKLFARSFSQEAMKYDPETNRYGAACVTEMEWLEALLRWRNSLIACTCENHPEWCVKRLPAFCPRCGRKLAAEWSIHIGEYSVPVAMGMRLTRFELGHSGDRDAAQVVAEVVSDPSAPNDPAGYGIRNLTDKPWIRILPNGRKKELPPGKAATMIDQMKVVCDAETKDEFVVKRMVGK